MTTWFLLLGLPTLALGLFAVLFTSRASRQCLAFPRNAIAGWILCTVIMIFYYRWRTAKMFQNAGLSQS